MKFDRVTLFILGFVVLAGAFSQLKSPTAAAATGQSPFARIFSLVDKSVSTAKLADYRDKYEALGSYFVVDPTGSQNLSSVREERTILGQAANTCLRIHGHE
jgi:hypothetical protein